MFRGLSAVRIINYGYNQTRFLTTAAANTLKVKEKVKRERELALLGGGQKRIDVQHKKGNDIFRISIEISFFVIKEN
jgi:hypothetical protein